MKKLSFIFGLILTLASFQIGQAAVDLDGDADGIIDASKGGLGALPTAAGQILQASAEGVFAWTAVIDDTKGNGHTTYVWSADKVFDQLALKLNATVLDDTKGNGDTAYVWSADKSFDQLALKVTKVASGTSALATAEIAAGACASAVTTTATGTATTDVITWAFNGDPTGVTGFGPTGGILKIVAYPSSNNVNFKVCNETASAITPGSALTLNWLVTR